MRYFLKFSLYWYFLVLLFFFFPLSSPHGPTGSEGCGFNGQIHMDYWVLWRKRDGTATLPRGECLRVPQPLSQEESAPTLALTGFYCFSGHITLRMVLIYYVQIRFWRLQKTKERMLLITSKRKDICKCKGKRGWTFTLILGRFSIDFRKLL